MPIKEILCSLLRGMSRESTPANGNGAEEARIRYCKLILYLENFCKEIEAIGRRKRQLEGGTERVKCMTMNEDERMKLREKVGLQWSKS